MRRPILYGVFVTTLLACCYMIGLVLFMLSLPNENEPFSVADTDGLVIFTGGSKRIEAAVALLANGYNKPVLISGVNPKVSKEKLVGLLPLERQALVTLDYDSLSTRDNVAATKLWVETNGLKSVGLITSFYHVPRSLLYWKRAGQLTQLSLYPVFPEAMPFSFMFREYHKYILTVFYII